MSSIKLTVNGKQVSAEVEDRTLLVHLLRDHLGLTGTHIGCDTSQCGACTVHIDGRSVKSCTVLVGQANGSSVTTMVEPRAAAPARRSASISAWDSPGAWVCPSPTITPRSLTTSAPTHGFGGACRRALSPSAMAININSEGENFMVAH